MYPICTLCPLSDDTSFRRSCTCIFAFVLQNKDTDSRLARRSQRQKINLIAHSVRAQSRFHPPSSSPNWFFGFHMRTLFRSPPPRSPEESRDSRRKPPRSSRESNPRSFRSSNRPLSPPSRSSLPRLQPRPPPRSPLPPIPPPRPRPPRPPIAARPRLSCSRGPNLSYARPRSPPRNESPRAPYARSRSPPRSPPSARLHLGPSRRGRCRTLL